MVLCFREKIEIPKQFRLKIHLWFSTYHWNSLFVKIRKKGREIKRKKKKEQENKKREREREREKSSAVPHGSVPKLFHLNLKFIHGSLYKESHNLRYYQKPKNSTLWFCKAGNLQNDKNYIEYKFHNY